MAFRALEDQEVTLPHVFSSPELVQAVGFARLDGASGGSWRRAFGKRCAGYAILPIDHSETFGNKKWGGFAPDRETAFGERGRPSESG